MHELVIFSILCIGSGEVDAHTFFSFLFSNLHAESDHVLDAADLIVY